MSLSKPVLQTYALRSYSQHKRARFHREMEARTVGIGNPVQYDQCRMYDGIYDMGFSMAGRAEIELCAEKNTEIILRYSERLHPNGRTDSEHIAKMLYSGEFQTERYICGGGPEGYHSKFTYHGFRYVEVEFLNGAVSEFSLTGQYMHTDLKPAGVFECSDGTLNKLQ